MRVRWRDGGVKEIGWRPYLFYLFQGTFDDSWLAELMLDVTAGPTTRLTLAELLLQRQRTAAAGLAVRRTLADEPQPLPLAVFTRAVGLLSRTDQEAMAVPVLRAAEAQYPPAEARIVRSMLFGRLLRDTSQAINPLQKEWMARRDAAGDDLAKQLAVADALWALRQQEAKDAYLHVLRASHDPALTWAAWLGYAETAPALAWGQRDGWAAVAWPAGRDAAREAFARGPVVSTAGRFAAGA